MNSYDVEWYHHLPPSVNEILRRLQEAGRKGFVVGGAVRDLWRGKPPKDFDLVSEATPEEIEALFPKTLGVGRSFGIMIVVTDDGPVEVARFRADGAYTDGRHPDEVVFADPAQDAQRRDFTINGLFYDPSTEKVLDYVGGVEDLRARVIRAVGDPALRFEEDALRMLRAVRFYAQLGDFTLDDGLRAAIWKQSSRLSLVSRERITQEMLGIFKASQPSRGLNLLVETNLWKPVFQTVPPVKAVLKKFDALATLYASHFGSPEPLLFFAAAKLWVPGFAPEKIFLLSREAKGALGETLALVARLKDFPKLGLAAKKEMAGHQEFPLAWSIFCATEGGAHAWLEDALVWRAEKEKAGLLRPEALLRGADLIARGVKPGPEVKKLLETVRTAQWNEEISTRAEAEQLLEKLLGERGDG